MALVKGVNSYVTVVEADAYFADRLDVDAWTSADATQKAQALVTATGVLDSQRWTGYAVSESQPLAFPREGGYFDEKVGRDVQMTTTIPARIATATYEQAHHLLSNDGLLDDTGSVTTLSVSAINLSTIITPNLIPNNVKRLIRPLLLNGGSNNWWRAN